MASIFQIGISRNTKCALKDGFRKSSHKCRFSAPEVSYIGHILNADGVQPDPEKVRAIQEMPPPTDKKGVERLLGTINYLANLFQICRLKHTPSESC